MTHGRRLSVEEIAAHLGADAYTIYRWIERKRLPAHKAGRIWKAIPPKPAGVEGFRVTDVDEWASWQCGGR